MEAYQEKIQRLVDALRTHQGAPVGLGKSTSNLFRDRKVLPKRVLRVKDFDKVLEVHQDGGWVDVEGMATYQHLVDVTLRHGVLPTVVPELKSITPGGAVAGVGIESSSFKYGLVHETVSEMEILLGDGRVVLCRPDNEYRDLYYGFPNSYGTLGYALRLRIKTVPAKRYVALQHIPHRDPETYFRDLEEWCEKDVDFIDGVVFAPDELYLTIGRFVDDAPYASDYTFQHIYYRSIRHRRTDYLTAFDYIWRWDTDWFWCSKNLYVQHPWVRRILGRSHLNSIAYTKIMRWNSKWGITKQLNQLLGIHTESVIQDVDIPLENAATFLRFFHGAIGILPIWICPVRAYRRDLPFHLYPLDPSKTYINFGFWDVVKSREVLPVGYYNRKVERKVRELGGIKSLYSESFYEPAEFWHIYHRSDYERLKAKYDPQKNFQDLYQKCILKE